MSRDGERKYIKLAFYYYRTSDRLWKWKLVILSNHCFISSKRRGAVCCSVQQLRVEKAPYAHRNDDRLDIGLVNIISTWSLIRDYGNRGTYVALEPNPTAVRNIYTSIWKDVMSFGGSQICKLDIPNNGTGQRFSWIVTDGDSVSIARSLFRVYSINWSYFNIHSARDLSLSTI